MSKRVTRSMSREPQPQPFPLAGELKAKGKGKAKAKLEPIIDLTLDDDEDDVQVVVDNAQPVPGPSKLRATATAKSKAKRGGRERNAQPAVATRPRQAPAPAPAAAAAVAPHNIDFFGDADDDYDAGAAFFEPVDGVGLYDGDGYDDFDDDYGLDEDEYDELMADLLHGDDGGDDDDQWMLPMPMPVLNHLAHAQHMHQPQHLPFEFNAAPQLQPAPQPLPEPMDVVDEAIVVVNEPIVVVNEPIVVPNEPVIVVDEPAPQPIVIDDAVEPAPAAADPLTQILEIVPDVDPEHASKLINTHLATYGAAGVVQPVLHLILEDPKYPRASKKRKSSTPAQQQPKKPKVDYASTDRPFTGGVAYYDLAVDRLVQDFPYVPKQFIRRTLAGQNGLYAPAFIALHALEELPAQLRGYARKKTATGKGKGREIDYETAEPELTKELKFIQEWRDAAGRGGNAPTAAAEPEDDEPGSDELAAEQGGVECGCCFGEYQFDTLLQCPDAHLFCILCVRAYAGTKLAEGTADIRCPSSADPPCAAVFAERELRRALNDKAMGLYYRVKTRRELEAAGLDNLEECPFCEYACVVDNADEKLFRCAREECGEVSCRKCKKRDHLPKSCKEAEQDNVLDAQHAVEEAMTKALMRNCPKCSKAFVKEMGCNKMTCPYCHTLSCYVCRKVITGYDHFNQMPGGGPRPTTSTAGKCPLWDDGQDVERRHQAEVEAAAKRALAEVKAAQPEVDAAAIKVDVPVAKARQPGPQVHAHPAIRVHPAIFAHHHPQIHIHNHMPALPNFVHLAHAVQPPPIQHLAMRDQLVAQAQQRQQEVLMQQRNYERLALLRDEQQAQRERLLAEQRERLRARQGEHELARQLRREEIAQQLRLEEFNRQEREEYQRRRREAVLQAEAQAAAPRRRRR